MRLETRKLFTFAELSDKAKEYALDHAWDWNIDGIEWWECTYEDAARIGLKLTSFDLGRSSECSGHFTGSVTDCAESILKEHGPDCESFKTAQAFLKDRTEVLSKWTEDGEDELSREGEDALEDCEKYFLQSLLEDYRIMLEKEYEYLTSNECVAESLEANECEFLEDGRRP